MKSLKNQLLPLKAGDRNALSYGGFIHKKQTVNPHAGWGFSEWRGQCVHGGWVNRSVGSFTHSLQTSNVVVDTSIEMHSNCRSWHLDGGKYEKGEGRNGTGLKMEVSAPASLQEGWRESETWVAGG